jgi:hypothetical protein
VGPISKVTRAKQKSWRPGSVKDLPYQCEALNSNSTTAKKKKKKEKEKRITM